VKDVLARVEQELDPARPHVQILAYGEVSAALLVPDLPGMVAKRMSGFTDAGMAAAYCELVHRYVRALEAVGVDVVPTEVLTVERRGRPPVVYLVQPLLDDLGNALLRTADDRALAAAIHAVLDRVWLLHERDAQPEMAIDAQLSNWSFATGQPVLIDIGTPFVREHGRYLFDQEILLSAIPPGLRAYYRRKGDVAAYMDDYFDPRLVAVDLLGNFVKEGAAQRLPVGLDAVNEWLGPRGLGRVTQAEVEQYYGKDAATLELFLRVRRLDRTLKRLLRRPYDFVLPGKVAR
jgi:hypothetical protein